MSSSPESDNPSQPSTNETKSSPSKPSSWLGLRPAYWLANTIEMWERLAYYTLRPIAPIYIAQADEPGGLQLTGDHKGMIYLMWALFQSFFPMFTGGFADRYGYKKVLIFALSMNALGYLIMAFMHHYAGFFAGILVLALGTAFFKPGIQGALAHLIDKEKSSVGWGIFYWVVNFGAFFGHLISPFLLGQEHSSAGWQYVFLFCALCAVINLFIIVFAFRDIPSGASKTESIGKVFIRTISNIFEPRLIAWILIMSGFWMMMYQLWDLQPNFIADWVDSTDLAAHLPVEAWKDTAADGRVFVDQQILLALNSNLILLLVIPITWLAGRMRTLTAMFYGMLGATLGVLIGGLTMNGWVLLLGIFFFSLGEMLTGPKKSEYMALIAPPGKKGLYLGYVNIPVGIGSGIGTWLSSMLYARMGEKATLALRYLCEHTPLIQSRSWNWWSIESMEMACGVKRTEAMTKLQEVLHQDGWQVTQLLWNTYDPQLYTWLPFGAIGVISALALYIYGQMAKRWADMNA